MPTWEELLNFVKENFAFAISKEGVLQVIDIYVEHLKKHHQASFESLDTDVAVTLFVNVDVLHSELRQVFNVTNNENDMQLYHFCSIWHSNYLNHLTLISV